MTKPRWASAVELLGFYGAVLLAIWIGQRVPLDIPVLILGIVLLAICSLSNRWHGDSRERIGWDHRNLDSCGRLTFRVCSPFLLIMFILALRAPTPPLPKILFGLLGYPLWALAQQYALLSFSANRLEDVVGRRPWTVAALNGLLFSLVHLPNPVLMSFTLVGGILFTRIFLENRHLVPVALAHAAAGFLLSLIFHAQYNVMMVGPAYSIWAGVPAPHP